MTDITIHRRCPLSPILKEDLMGYIYYDEKKIQLSVNDIEICNDEEWAGTEEQLAIVQGHRLWRDFQFVWEYAELGLHVQEIKGFMAHSLDRLIDIYKFIGYGEVVLAHDGNFGHESISVGNAGAKVVYKFLARMKLDLGIDLDWEFAMHGLFPLSHNVKLTTTEYALLAGFSHIGAVRNEVCKKSNPLLADKEGNNLVISIKEARKHLLNKRKFIASKGVDYGKP